MRNCSATRKNELLENQFLAFVHPDDVPATLLEIEKLKSGALTINFVNRYRKKDGSYLWFDWNTTPDPVSGKLYAIARDITSRKLVEEQLKQSEERWRSLINFSPLSINVTNANGILLETNQATLDLMGFATKEELMARNAEEYYGDVNDRVKMFHLLNKDGFVKNYEFKVKRKNGEQIWISNSAAPIKLNNQETILISASLDITARKRAEEQLQEANKELESFSYSVAHDLRAPLRSVHGYAEMLSQDYKEKLDDEAKRIIGTIKQNASKMGTLIDDLLSFSRLGRKEIQLRKIDMNELIEDVLLEIKKSISHKAVIRAENLHDAMGDYNLIFQVMVNLLSNAIKYSSKNAEPIIRISSEVKNKEVIFSVKDNGAGFEMKYYDKLFGVFQRLHTEREFEGTGVGLAIVNRIITKHGGKIWAEGKVDNGATFYFTLLKG